MTLTPAQHEFLSRHFSDPLFYQKEIRSGMSIRGWKVMRPYNPASITLSFTEFDTPLTRDILTQNDSSLTSPYYHVTILGPFSWWLPSSSGPSCLTCTPEPWMREWEGLRQSMWDRSMMEVVR